MYIPVSRPSRGRCSSTTVLHSTPQHSRSVTLVLRPTLPSCTLFKTAAPAKAELPCNASGQTIKSCLKQQCAAPPACRQSQASYPAKAPRFVHFGTDLEHTRWFYKTETPRHASRDPEFEVSLPCSSAPEHAPPSAATVRFIPIRKPSPSFSPYEPSPVVLESVEHASSTLTGTVKVHNLAFEKDVSVRYTMDDWKTVEDTPASFVRTIVGVDGCRPGIDRFRFSIPVSSAASSSHTQTTISMCVCYRVNGQDHWDNNKGANYSFRLAPTTAAAVAAATSRTKPDKKRIGNAKEMHKGTRAFEFGFNASGSCRSPSPLSSLGGVSSADARRYMRYSEAKFSTASYRSTPPPTYNHSQQPMPMQAIPAAPGLPTHSAAPWSANLYSNNYSGIYHSQSPPLSTSPIMRTGSPLATSHVWSPYPATLLHC